MSDIFPEPTQAQQDAMRASGLRPLEIWVPDTSMPGFADECRRQAVLAARSDAGDTELAQFMDAALCPSLWSSGKGP